MRPALSYADIFVVADNTMLLPAAVLVNSVQRHASMPVRASVLANDAKIAAPRNSDARLREIAESKGYRGTALLLAAFGLVSGDIAPLLRGEFGAHLVLLPEADEEIGNLPGFGPADRAARTEAIASVSCDEKSWRERPAAEPLGEKIARRLPSAWGRQDPVRPTRRSDIMAIPHFGPGSRRSMFRERRGSSNCGS